MFFLLASYRELMHSSSANCPKADSTSSHQATPFTKSSVSPDKGDTILEVAAATCACGRSFSPLVKTVVCLDATASMLQVGKEAADEPLRATEDRHVKKGNVHFAEW